MLAGCSAESDWSLARLFDAAPAAPEADQAKRRHDPVAHVQQMLDRLGYTPGPIDGIAGPRTRQAIASYQADAGLLQDGQVSEALKNNLSAAVKAGTQRTGARTPKSTPRPDYALGSTFVYSDGRVETVAGLEGDRIHWRSNRGDEYTAYRNFLLPSLGWTSATETGRRVADAPPARITSGPHDSGARGGE